MTSPPEEQRDSFIAKFTHEVGAVAQAAFAKLRKRLPGAIVLVYDNYNALAIGFGPTDRASEAICSLPRLWNKHADGVSLLQNAGLFVGQLDHGHLTQGMIPHPGPRVTPA